MDVFKEASYRLWQLVFNTTLEGKLERYSDKESSPDLQRSRTGPWLGAACLPSSYQVAGISGFTVKCSRLFSKNLNGTKRDALQNCTHNLQILLSLSLVFLNLDLSGLVFTPTWWATRTVTDPSGR